nr:hypothetical protein [Parachlamydiaceae bacterium]
MEFSIHFSRKVVVLMMFSLCAAVNAEYHGSQQSIARGESVRSEGGAASYRSDHGHTYQQKVGRDEAYHP